MRTRKKLNSKRPYCVIISIITMWSFLFNATFVGISWAKEYESSQLRPIAVSERTTRRLVGAAVGPFNMALPPSSAQPVQSVMAPFSQANYNAADLENAFAEAIVKFDNLGQASELSQIIVQGIRDTYENNTPEFIKMQLQRRLDVVRTFRQRFGDGPVSLVRAPGRVNLIGEHTDNQDGFVLPVALDKDIIIAFRPTNDGSVSLHNMDQSQYRNGVPDENLTPFDANKVPFSRETGKAPETLPIGPNGENVKIYGKTFTYIMGSAKGLREFVDHDIKGVQMLIDGRPEYDGIPQRAGVSSSSALTVAAAIALASANDINIGPIQLSELTCEWERYQTGGGMMDQFTSINGQKGHAIFLDCRRVTNPATTEDAFHFEALPLPKGYRLVAMHTRVEAAQVDSEYNERRTCVEIGTRWLRYLFSQRFPGTENKIQRIRDLTPENLGLAEQQIEEVLNLLPVQLTQEQILNSDYGHSDRVFLLEIFKDRPTKRSAYRIQQICKYHLAENQRVLTARKALQDGDIAAFAKAVNEGQTNNIDGGAEKGIEISCPELGIITSLALKHGAISARLSGKGWGGVAVALVPPDIDVDRFMEKIISEYEIETREHYIRIAREESLLTGEEKRPKPPIRLNRGTDIFVCSTSRGAGIDRYSPGEAQDIARLKTDIYNNGATADLLPFLQRAGMLSAEGKLVPASIPTIISVTSAIANDDSLERTKKSIALSNLIRLLGESKDKRAIPALEAIAKDPKQIRAVESAAAAAIAIIEGRPIIQPSAPPARPSGRASFTTSPFAATSGLKSPPTEALAAI